MTPHAKLRKEICDWLKEIGAWYVCTNSQGYGRKGIPDILACVRGKFVAIEVKVLPDKPSPWQMRELKAVQDAHGISVVAYSVEALNRILGFELNRDENSLGQLTHEILRAPTDPVIEPDGKGGYRRKALPFRKLCS